jgi:tripartite-type tricarboxylate transporter receptor subunit TctC
MKAEQRRKTMSKRVCWTLLAAASLASGLALGQTYPSRTIHLVSGVTPGSASDTTARVIAEKMQASMGQPVIVENKLGAGGLIGAAYVAKAEPDGYWINIYTSAFTVAPLINPGTLDPKDLAPVATIGVVPTVLVVSTAKNYKSVADLVAAAKAKPGAIVATTAGIGSSTHMQLARFRVSAGIELLELPMKGAPDALTEVLTGRADFYFALPFQVGPQVKEGKLRALAVGAAKRSPLFPDVPTTVEAGYPNSDYNFWIGALVAAKTPRDIMARLNKEINAAVASPEVRERFLKLGVEPLSMSLPEFEAMIKNELVANAQLIKTAGIKAE